MNELAWRVLGAVFFLGVIAWRLGWWWDGGSAVFWVETSVYALIVLAYVRRTPAYERAHGALEVLLPLVGAVAPFALLAAPWRPVVSERAYVALLLAGGGLAAVSYAFLGGSFAILVEARALRASGPYRFVRHPIYLGQLIAATGVFLGRCVFWEGLVLAAFASVQVARAVLEERKLLRATPGYAEYRARTWMLVPFVL